MVKVFYSKKNGEIVTIHARIDVVYSEDKTNRLRETKNDDLFNQLQNRYFDIEKSNDAKIINENKYSFNSELKEEIYNKLIDMKQDVRVAMFLRFFKDLTISEIAKIMDCYKWEAQDLIRQGCYCIRKFLNNDIHEQDELESDFN